MQSRSWRVRDPPGDPADRGPTSRGGYPGLLREAPGIVTKITYGNLAPEKILFFRRFAMVGAGPGRGAVVRHKKSLEKEGLVYYNKCRTIVAILGKGEQKQTGTAAGRRSFHGYFEIGVFCFRS